ncbi:porin [Bordetella holmesii]|uniref:Outer membrane porin protein n=2 Tax=Bordetella holmesii TaxID=35814 RepID=A0ABN0RUL8_9BORD|nr:porin [Bordetella holmesii]AHV91363.1 outer membrane porin protein [Bordetella holmesii ATCC 51541]AIT26859.1 outer membrane porin protein [Bordetella holmesii 44057]EWM42704.1 outer membrane porin protein [Bordetella holmesii 41130]EWM47444.1 outer membrane porin protein [Bordetella holmesii 35009]EWM51606.1 outer membrane porin protein [Bordetella holmesii 70147]
MKKTLLAAALLAGFAGVAQAETSVTLYGIIDTGIGYNKLKGSNYDSSRVGMINGVQNGSRWGLRGTEDLGDGLQAVFQLESGFDSGNGQSGQGSRLFGRQATIGLQSNSWGRLDFGRQTNIASKYFGSIDPFGAGFGQANIGVGLSSANTVRYDNMVMYQTPSFSGFQFGVGYSFSADDTKTDKDGFVNGVYTKNGAPGQTGFATADNTRAITTGLRYTNGPLNVALSYDQLNASNKLPNAQTNATPRAYAIGGSYDFEVVKLALAYGRTTDGWFTGQALPSGSTLFGFTSNVFADGFKANSYMVGLSAPIGGASNVFGSWQMVDPSNNKLTNVKGADETMNVFSLGYTYDLSKRTNLYAYASYAKDYAFIDGVKSTAVGVGLRHRF